MVRIIWASTKQTLITMSEEETEPLVRGEQLVNLLTQIVLILMTHTHKEPGTALSGRLN